MRGSFNHFVTSRIFTAAVVAVLALAAVPLSTRTAMAQDAGGELSESDRKGIARQLLEQGVQAQTDGKHEEAIALFEKADQVYEHPAHSYFRAQSLAALNRLHEAKEAYQVFVVAEPSTDQMRQRQDQAKKEIEKLDRRIPKLTVEVDAAVVKQLAVLLDGKALPAAALNVSMPLNPGQHIISVESDKYELATGPLEITLDEGAAKSIQLDLRERPADSPPPTSSTTTEGAPPPSSPPPARPTPARPEPKKSKGLLIGGAAVGGAGIAGLVVGGVLLARAGQKGSDFDDLYDGCFTTNGRTECSPDRTSALDDLTKEEESARTGAAVSFAVGGAALAAGVTMIVLATGKKEKPVARRIRPIIGVRSLGVEGKF